MQENKELIARIEELIKEQVAELGEDITKMEAHEISANLFCKVANDKSMLYSWKGQEILYLVPQEDGSWRMFSKS